jgi:hypothetical protein
MEAGNSRNEYRSLMMFAAGDVVLEKSPESDFMLIQDSACR